MSQWIRGGVAAARDRATRHSLVLPAVILIVGAAFRFYNLNWDNGHQLHPDERWIFEVVSGANGHPPLSWPTSLSQFFSTASPLDPHFFAYGTLPFYLLSLVAGTISLIATHIPFLSEWSGVNTYGGLPLLGRGLSGLLDLCTVYLTFLLARKVYGYWTGVLAMALVACTVLDIQLAHFYAVDTVLVPICLLALLAAVSIAQSNSRAAYLWGGIALGAAMATKTTALLLVVPLGAAAALEAWNSRPFARGDSLVGAARAHYLDVAEHLNGNLQRMLFTFLIGAAVFAVLEPYAIIDRTQLVSDIAQQTQFLVSNNPPFSVPFTIQYANTVPYVYQFANLVFWCMGIPLGLTAFGGVAFALIRLFGLRFRNDEAVLLLWVVPYFLFVGRFFAKFNRYMLPITPVMALFGAALLVALIAWLRPRPRVIGWAVLATVVSVSFFYSLAYMNIYAHPNTRVAASRWMFSHIKPGTVIAEEGAWDDPLPMDEQGHSGTEYPELQLNLYDADTSAKVQRLANMLSQARYLIMSSERMIGSIPKLPDRYPMTVRYYHLLFSNKLNFRLAAHFQQHPQLGPIVVHDYSADESFHVYDHPNVQIFRRVANYSPAKLVALLSVPQTTTQGQAVAPKPVRISPDPRLMLSAAAWRTDSRGLTMDQMFPPAGFAMQHPILVWLILLELIGMFAFPLTALLFSNLHDRGFVISKTIGLLVVAYFVWISTRLGLATFDQGLSVLSIAVLGCLGAVLLYTQWRELWAFFRHEWRRVVCSEMVFLVALAFFLALRMWYPDLGHQYSPVSASNLGAGRMGEKQMELAFLNAIVRSRTFPPFDPFFAHGYINYYYYGFFLVGLLCKLTEIAPTVGFNLAVATFFALLAASVFSITFNLTRRVLPGLMAVLLVAVIGNLNGGWQLVRGLMQVASVHSSVPIWGGALDVTSGLWQALVQRQPLPPFDFWESTRILPPVGMSISEFPYFTYLFADLHPHLIAYPITVAVAALAVNQALGGYRSIGRAAVAAVAGGLLLGAIAVTNPWDYPTYAIVLVLGAATGLYAFRHRSSWRSLAAMGLWLGVIIISSALLYVPFKHDYQTVFASGLGMTRDIPLSGLEGPGTTASQAREMLVTPLHLYLEHFGLFFFILFSYIGALLALDAGGRRWLHGQIMWLKFVLYHCDRPASVWRATQIVRGRVKGRQPVLDGSLLLGLGILVIGLAVLQYFLLAFLSLALGLLLLLALRLAHEKSGSELFVFGLLALPIALSMLSQVFYIRDFLDGGSAFRMNTIFKFYNQAWVLFGIGCACALYFLSVRFIPDKRAESNAEDTRLLAVGASNPHAWLWLRPQHRSLGFASLVGASSISTPTDAPGRESTERMGGESRGSHLMTRLNDSGAVRLLSRSPLWTSCLVLLIAASLIYTYAGTVSRETYRQSWLAENSVPLTLDGMAFMKVAYPGDFAGIRWLDAHVAGAQVIAEAANTDYDWRSRVSMFTGLPTIFNGIHESEQRFGDEIDPTGLCNAVRDPVSCLRNIHSRPDDVQRLYDSRSAAAAWQVIRHYGVRYIFVGYSERQVYSAAGLGKFDRMVGHGLQVAFRHPGVTIYRVTA
ncbi:MAG TPA: DUF2298 domain-containing protein [Chloroflexota bacterium]